MQVQCIAILICQLKATMHCCVSLALCLIQSVVSMTNLVCKEMTLRVYIVFDFDICSHSYEVFSVS